MAINGGEVRKYRFMHQNSRIYPFIGMLPVYYFVILSRVHIELLARKHFRT